MQIIRNSNKNISHNTSARKAKPKYIVIHATADNGATGQNEIDYFNKKSTTRASADIFCDGKIYVYNCDILHRYCWAVGGRKLSKTCGGSMYGIVKNSNSVSVEMCCHKDESGIWRVSDETYKSTIDVIRILMEEFDIPNKNVIRHYDVTGKSCPCVYGFIAENGSDLLWQKMKKEIAVHENPEPGQTKITNNTLTVDGIMGKQTTIASQKFFGTQQDGIISGQYSGNLRRCPGITTMQVGHGGSNFVRELQKWLGVTSDGSLGQQTIQAWQRKMNTTIDGYISKPSMLIKAWQKYLNEVL